MTGSRFKTGQRIKDFVIKKCLNKGGMADLYLARDPVLKRDILIKVLSNRFGRDTDIYNQFMTEARIQANLANQHIVPVFEIFFNNSLPCLVIPFIEGTDLAEIIRKADKKRKYKGYEGALSQERAIHILLQILEGISFIHKYGIIHGDIKPSNILLDKEGIVRIVDFGISSRISNEETQERESLSGGTPYFMAPEQILKEPVDFRSDIYSLGATFFMILTGEYPSGTKKNFFELLEYHFEGSLDHPKNTLDKIPDINPGIQKIILKALEPSPGNRYQTCLEFSLALKEYHPSEMYTELLRTSIMSKNNLTFEERVYLDNISEKCGLKIEDAQRLEMNIRKEMQVPPPDFEEEYLKGLQLLSGLGSAEDELFINKLDNTYISQGRISGQRAQSLKKDKIT